MKTRISIIVFCVFLTNCQMSAPEGQKVLSEIMSTDSKVIRNKNQIHGQSQFLKMRIHPQIQGPDIHGGQWILLQVDRKKVDLESLFERLNKKGTNENELLSEQ